MHTSRPCCGFWLLVPHGCEDGLVIEARFLHRVEEVEQVVRREQLTASGPDPLSESWALRRLDERLVEPGVRLAEVIATAYAPEVFDGLGQGPDVGITSPSCRKARRLRLEAHPEVQEVVELTSLLEHPGSPGGQRPLELGHEGAAMGAPAHLDVTRILQDLECFTQAQPGNAELGCELALGGQALTGTDLTSVDQPPDVSSHSMDQRGARAE